MSDIKFTITLEYSLPASYVDDPTDLAEFIKQSMERFDDPFDMLREQEVISESDLVEVQIEYKADKITLKEEWSSDEIKNTTD